jgi:hypothetical protein
MTTDPVRSFLALLHDVKISGSNQWMARCPAHEDRKASLSISAGTDGRVLLNCFAGCTPEAIVHSVGIEMSALFVDDRQESRESSWQIRDCEGNVVATKKRVDRPGQEKEMWWERGGTKGLKGFKLADMPIYGSELLPAMPDGATVVLCEGEKAADAVRAAGLNGLGTACGASATPSPAILAPLVRFDVVLWPDNDKVGRNHMERIAKTLQGASIRWATWEGAPVKGDAADTTGEAIRAIVEAAGDKGEVGKEIMRDLGMDEIAAPLVTTEDRTVRVEWVSKQISAEARGLKEHSDGRITGHLRIWTTLPGTARDLRSAQFTFTALRSRTELANDLTKKLGEINWDSMIEFFCSKVTEFVQRGDPVETVTPGDAVDPTRFALWPLLLHGHPTIIFGQEGTAKSYLALLIGYLAVSGSTEAEALGLHLDAPLRSMLYLDWEGDVDVLRERLNFLAKGMGLPVIPIQYRKCRSTLINDLDAIKANLTTQPDLLVIDSLIPAVGGDVNLTQPANDFFAAVKAFDCTTLILGHVAKGAANTPGATVFGSGVFQQRARSAWEIRRDQEEEEDTILVGLVHKKMNYGRRERPLGFRFTFLPDRVTVAREDVANFPAMENARGLTTRIVHHLLSSGKQSPQQISEALGVESAKVSATLSYLRTKRMVARLERGLWGAVVHQEEKRSWVDF